MKPDDFAIQRDSRYQKTLRRDTMRQQGRRMAHKLGVAYEQAVIWPQWQHTRPAKPKTLSTCIMTMNSEHRIGPLLEYIRPFSDEIVVAVDSKTTDNTFKVCQAQGLCDELFVIQSDALTVNAGLEELVSRCHSNWILRLDDDEFPEPHFAHYKQGILSQQKYTHYKMPRLHLNNINPLTWINDGYLYPDYQMRLFKNDTSLLSFPGAVGHLGIRCAGPKGRLNSINLIHLNLAINPRFKREEKLATYIKRLNGEWVHPVNEHALLFEDFNYQIEAYNYPDAGFCERLTESTHAHSVS